MAVSRKAMTEGLSKWASSDPLSPSVRHWGSTNYGMIATGNHFNFDSLRGAPPLVSKGSLRAPSLVLGRTGGLPHQSADWFAMTLFFLWCPEEPGDCHASVRTGSQ